MTSDFDDTLRLRAAIGYCVMNWALVEEELSIFFHALHGGPYENADVMWSSVRSFELKLQMLNAIVPNSDLHETSKQRWRLISQHIPSQYRLRNKVVHSTPSDVREGSHVRQCVVPFRSLFGDSHEPLDAATIEDYGLAFAVLREAIATINPLLKKPGRRHPRPTKQDHDLIGRLRKEDDRRREAQRHRALAWRQYLERNPDLKLD